jgi:hypothetical protein
VGKTLIGKEVEAVGTTEVSLIGKELVALLRSMVEMPRRGWPKIAMPAILEMSIVG